MAESLLPCRLHLAQDYPEIGDTFNYQSEVGQLLKELTNLDTRSHSKAAQTDISLSGDVPTVQTTHNQPSCEEKERVLRLHQILSVVEHDKEPKACCFSVDTNNGG